jgi:hypothetical protein
MNRQFPNQSISLSIMISEAVYRLVVSVERLVRFGHKVFGSGK